MFASFMAVHRIVVETIYSKLQNLVIAQGNHQSHEDSSYHKCLWNFYFHFLILRALLFETCVPGLVLAVLLGWLDHSVRSVQICPLNCQILPHPFDYESKDQHLVPRGRVISLWWYICETFQFINHMWVCSMPLLADTVLPAQRWTKCDGPAGRRALWLIFGGIRWS